MTIKDTLTEARELPSATPKETLLGKAFRLDSWEVKPTKFGLRKLATVVVDGEDEPSTVWLSGALLDRQLDKLEERDEIPARVRLVWSDIVDGAFELVDANDAYNEVALTVLGAPDKPKKSRR